MSKSHQSPEWSFDPQALESVSDFDMFIRALARGMLYGGRYSLRLGAGMEFSQYRPYSQGDDLRRLDWKMYGRTERFYIKQSEVETDIRFNLVIDHSLSMTYAEEDLSKLNYAKVLAALFAYVALKNGDGFCLISGENSLPLGHGDKQWQRFLHSLASLQPKPDFQPEVLKQTQPGVTLVFSDFFAEGKEWPDLLSSFNLSRSEVYAFHILGQAEQSLDFSGAIAFQDLETQQRVQVDARKQGEAYRKKFIEWLTSFKTDLIDQGIWYEPTLLSTYPGKLVQRFLRKTKTTIGG